MPQTYECADQPDDDGQGQQAREQAAGIAFHCVMTVM
jgi:hypothetical protein